MKTIVFQGDSITACGRLKYDVDVMGEGYARFVRASLAYDYPGEYKFYNRGVSGDRVMVSMTCGMNWISETVLIMKNLKRFIA